MARGLGGTWRLGVVMVLGCNAITGIDNLPAARHEVSVPDAGSVADGGACEHDCEAGMSRCVNGVEESCGEHDGDACRDWGAPQSCGSLGCGPVACCEARAGEPCAVSPVNCGCPDGDVCRINLVDGNSRCAGSVQSVLPFGRCEESEDCQSGSACVDGVCRPYCNAGMPCASGAGECEPIADSGLGSCTGHCDPLDPARSDAEFSGCGPGVHCAPGSTLGGTSSRCASASGGARRFAQCTEDSDCVSGLGCVEGRCVPWCRPGTSCGSEYYDCDTSASDRQISPGATVFACRALPCQVPADAACAVLPENCGCPAGQACQLDPLSGIARCEASGTAAPYAACRSNADCAPGNTCAFILPGVDEGVCYPYCSDELPCPSNQGECALLKTPSPLPVCTGHCDPLNPSRTDAVFQGCGPGVYCAPPASSIEGPAYGVCAGPAGSKSLGEACDDRSIECGAGLACPGGECAPWCREDANCNGARFPGCISIGAFIGGPDDPIGFCLGD